MSFMVNYFEMARDIMGVVPRVVEVPFGVIYVGENLSMQGRKNVAGLILNLEKRVFHHRCLLFRKDIPIRSHEETDQEIVANYGGEIRIVGPGRLIKLREHDVAYSVSGSEGFFHGFEKYRLTDEGFIYVAKALRPEFVDGDSFRVPDNSYCGD